MVCRGVNKLNKTCLSPLWMALVALYAPLNSLPANGQTTQQAPVETEPLYLPQETAAFSQVASQNGVVEIPQPETVASPEVLVQNLTKPTPTQTTKDADTKTPASTLDIQPSAPEVLVQNLTKPTPTQTTKDTDTKTPASTLDIQPPAPEVLVQNLTKPTPTQTTKDTDTKTPASPSGTQAAPQQKTPYQIQISPELLPKENKNPPAAPNNTAPKQLTPNTDPESQSSPLIPPTGSPGTQGAPQQETPNQIQISPGTPLPQDNNNQPGVQPTPPSLQPTPPPLPGNAQPSQAPELTEPRVLAAEVVVRTETGQLSQELQNQVYGAIRTQPGRTTTRSQLQEDINSIFATGYFANVRAVPEDTPLGVRVTFVVQPNPILSNVQVQANVGTGVPSVLPPKVVDNIFREQYGTILNLRRFQEGVKQLNKWYQDNGYVLAQVIQAPQVAANGTVTLQVAEGVIEDVQIKFRNKEGDETDDKGRPIRGRTRPFIITRELQLRAGKVFNRTQVQSDLQRVYRLGLFEDVQVSLNPGQDPRKVIVVVNVNQRGTGNIAAGAGISSASGLFGTLSYQQQNLGGNNQNLGAELQIGQRETLYDIRFTDPWIAGDPYRTSYTANIFRRRSTSLIFSGGPTEVDIVTDGDRETPRVLRLGGGVNFTRPLSKDVFKDSEWIASAGFQYQRVSIRDNNGTVRRRDEAGNQLSFSGTGLDDLLTLQLGVVRDRRNDLLQPTRGSLLRFGVEQSVPIGLGSILLNRLRASYSQYIPVRFTNFTKGPQALAFNVQTGTVIGDLPPYEAFSLGGSNSVRGYNEGDLGSGRSFVQATAEYRFPLISIIGGALFFDVGSDLGSASSVPGNPAGARNKPGTGFGYGIGVRVRSPLGQIRVDYGINDQGNSQINFGIGERF